MEKTDAKNSNYSEKFNLKYDKKEEIIKKKLAEIALRSENYHKIPPIIGMVIADQYGNTILVIEYESYKTNHYGPIKTYLSEDDKSLLEIDLISMYFSSLKAFATQTNIKNLSNFQIHGSNIKIQIYFLLNKFMLILFLNSNTELNVKEQTTIIDYFKQNLLEYEYEFDNFNANISKKIIRTVEIKAKNLLRKLNKQYLQEYNKIYSKKHELIERITMQIDPIIQIELEEYLEHLPHDIVVNLSKDLKGKIQDKLFDIQNEFFVS